MNKWSSHWLRIGEWLLSRRWWLVMSAILGVSYFEFVEYQPFVRGVNLHFFFEILFYGVVLPASTGLALAWLAASRAELAWAMYYQDLIPNLTLQMHNAHTYDELANVFMQFVKVVIPVVGITVYKYEQGDKNYKTILSWSLNSENPLPDSYFVCATETCPFITDQDEKDTPIVLQPCRDPQVASLSRKLRYYCLPFLFSNVMVAGARLYLPASGLPSNEQMRLLKEIAPETASAFQRIQLEDSLRQRDDSFKAEQQRVARDVHDALGHSLAYLRLRLDQIGMEINQARTETVQRDVESLRDVAKEAYDQMRGVLILLSPDHTSDISGKLMNYAEKISHRVNFQIRFQQHGQPRGLSPLTQRNIFYIFQETLTNIEKHAYPQKVEVEMNWQEASLEVKVTDDGVGFDPSLPTQNGHFGLNNMRERALESGAQLLITSQEGCGAQFALRIPYEETS